MKFISIYLITVACDKNFSVCVVDWNNSCLKFTWNLGMPVFSLTAK